MKSQRKLGPVEPALAILLIILAAVALFSFSSCVNQKKVQAWNDGHQEEASRYCTDHWPPHGDTIINITIDSSEYTQAMSDLNGSVYYLNELNDSLISVIAAGDTACSKYVRALQQQKDKTIQLQQQAKNLKPKIIYVDSSKTIIDSAKTVTVRLENTRLKKEADVNKKDITRLKADKKLYTWMLIAAGLMIILLIVLFFKKKSNPVLNKL